MTIGSYASDYNQGQILKGLVEGEIPINLASATLAALRSWTRVSEMRG